MLCWGSRINGEVENRWTTLTVNDAYVGITGGKHLLDKIIVKELPRTEENHVTVDNVLAVLNSHVESEFYTRRLQFPSD